ncbi:cathepsin L1-like protein [Dinothrombium tinctorium]|uniref:Cathepsin L1-like protein n=1 Tax=Dinothrombium tinctorium TaxID=1965070 RepID=A0A3S3PS67_9ACAR|nr:cathepsin L1-like protein [Dinothrombium tinctorium]
MRHKSILLKSFTLKLNDEKKHNKVYSANEESYRRKVFAQNLKKILESNLEADLGMRSFKLAVNHYADMTPQEFALKMTGLRRGKPPTILKAAYRASFNRTSNRTIPVRPFNRTLKATKLPKNFDWREKGVVTSVNNQGECGACWALAASAALESHNAIKTGKLVRLSSQNLIDCVTEGSDGCEGGLMDPAFDYVHKNDGIDTEESYPYEGRKSVCRYSEAAKGASCKGYVDIEPFDEVAMMQAVANSGPIVVGLDGDSLFFQFYS